MTQLMEVTPPFNRGGTRYYIEGVRVSKHEFCGVLLRARGEHLGGTPEQVRARMQPDFIDKRCTNRQGDTMQRA